MLSHDAFLEDNTQVRKDTGATSCSITTLQTENLKSRRSKEWMDGWPRLLLYYYLLSMIHSSQFEQFSCTV